MRRVFIRGAFLLVTFAAGCSSFGASPGGSSGEIPDGGDAEAASGVDGGPPSPSARCEGVPPATEYAGLYVAAGNAEGSETDEIVRAPLRCDGSVGDWKTLDVKLPRTFAWGGVTVIEDRVVLFGGQHSAGGAVYSKQAWVGTRTADGTLGKLIPTPDIEDLARWRFAVAETTKAAYVLGGVIPNSSEDAAAAPEGTATILFDGGFQTVTKRIDRLSFSSSGTLQSRRVADIYTPLTRFVASAAGDRLVAHGGIGSGAAIQVADIDANGDLGPWRSVGDFVAGQFDGTAVPSGDGVYLIGGESDPTAVGFVKLVAGKDPTFIRLQPLSAPLPFVTSATSRGWVYLLKPNDPVIRYGKLAVDGLTLLSAPPLPKAREVSSIFIF